MNDDESFGMKHLSRHDDQEELVRKIMEKHKIDRKEAIRHLQHWGYWEEEK